MTVIPLRLKWGWLRLILGVAQMGLVVAAVVSYVHNGVDAITLLLGLLATLTTLVSRYLYEGRTKPPLDASHRRTTP